MLVGLVIPARQVHASPTRDQLPPIALQGKDGNLSVMVFLGVGTAVISIPMMGQVPVRVCDGSDCEVYTTNYLSSVEGYSGHRWVTLDLSIGQRFNKRPVTAQVPTDFLDSSKGWSVASNAVTAWSDPQVWFQRQASRPLLDITFATLDSTTMTKADLCANYREGLTWTSSMSSFSALDITGYTTARYDLYENGALKKTQDVSSSLSGQTSIPGCGTGAFGPFSMTRIDGMTAGRSYKLIYTLSGAGKTDLTATMDYVTPGACPTGDIVLPPSPRAYYYGALASDGTILSYAMTGLAGWRFDGLLGSRLGPVYFSASKVGPFKGKLLDIKTSTEKWRYLSDVDDWALVLDAAVPQSATNVLANTVFADCSSTSVKATLKIDESSVPAAQQGCAIDGNEVVPLRPGKCIVKADVTSAGVSSSGVRKKTTPVSVTMNYVISSIGTFTRSATTTTSSVVTPLRATAAPKAVRLRNGAVIAPRSTVKKKSVLSARALLSPSKGSTVVRVVSKTPTVCRASGASLRMLKAGTCRYVASVKRKGKTSSATISLRVN